MKLWHIFASLAASAVLLRLFIWAFPTATKTAFYLDLFKSAFGIA